MENIVFERTLPLKKLKIKCKYNQSSQVLWVYSANRLGQLGFNQFGQKYRE